MRNTIEKIEPGAFAIPRDRHDASLRANGRDLILTNVNKVFFPATGATKGDLPSQAVSVVDRLVHCSEGIAIGGEPYQPAQSVYCRICPISAA
jgi:hypothetical protein